MIIVFGQTKLAKITTIDQDLTVAAKCRVVDYIKFEGTHKYRIREKQLFLDEKTYVPQFDYPQSLELSDIEESIDIVNQAPKIINENIDVIGGNKAELHIASLIYNLKGAQLVIAAASMNVNETNSAVNTHAAKEFQELNIELYCDMN